MAGSVQGGYLAGLASQHRVNFWHRSRSMQISLITSFPECGELKQDAAVWQFRFQGADHDHESGPGCKSRSELQVGVRSSREPGIAEYWELQVWKCV